MLNYLTDDELNLSANPLETEQSSNLKKLFKRSVKSGDSFISDKLIKSCLLQISSNQDHFGAGLLEIALKYRNTAATESLIEALTSNEDILEDI